MRLKEGTTFTFLILGMVFWGMSFIWYKQAYDNFTPITLIFLRLLISTPLLLFAALALKRLRWPRIKDLPAFMFLAFFEPFLYFIGESFGMLFVSSSLAAILIAIIPLITPFVGYYFFKERLTLNNYLGILVSFAGVVMVVYAEGASGKAPWYGIMLMLLAVLSTQGYAIVLKRLSDDYNAVSIIWVQNFIGSLYFLPLFLIFESGNLRLSGLNLKELMPLFYLSVFASALAFLFFIQGIKRIGITKAVVFTNFIPIVTAIFALFILKEKISFFKAGGILITIVGLFMSQASGWSRIRIFSRVR
jgi:drug/metabolite transporter (DMT)-like permease